MTMARTWVGLISLLMWLSACAVQLAPAYDKQMVEGLQSVSEAVMIQFATLEDGSSRDAFPLHVERHDALIGRLDALRLASESRYFPAGPTSGLFRRFNLASNIENSEGYESPTTKAIEIMLGTLRELRRKHRDDGLKPSFVEASRGQFAIVLDQALTYEKALER